MSTDTPNIVEYIIAVINEFAARHKISAIQSYNYLAEHKGMQFLEKYYGINHTLSFNEIVDDLTELCSNNGGKLL